MGVYKGNKTKVSFKADTSHTKLLIKVGKTSAERSIKETKAMGLPITYLEDGKIIRESHDGKKEVIGKV
jgi:hypothetical protein